MRYFESSEHYPSEFVLGERLGRYEYSGGTSHKFYHVMVDTSGRYWAFFGRIGAKNPQSRGFSTQREVAEVLEEKRRKGYTFVYGSATSEIQGIAERQQHLDHVLQAAPPETAAPSRRARL